MQSGLLLLLFAGEEADARHDPEVAQAISAGIPDDWPSSGTLEVVWHGGEPLTIGTAAMRQLFAPFNSSAGRVGSRM